MRYRFRLWGALLLVLITTAAARNEPTVEELKARVASTSVRDRPHLCVEIAQKQLTEADKLYAASDFDKGQVALTDVVAYSELARDYAIQSHKYQKQTEIATRNMTRKLNDMLHSLGGPDQAPVRDAINRLQRVRDDLLASMFPKGAK
jgi:NAD-specific glutamate dehydrogenase